MSSLSEISDYFDKLTDALSSVGTDILRMRYVNPRGIVRDIVQTDFDFSNDQLIEADGELVSSVRAPGGSQINGQAKSSGQYSLLVRWLNEEDELIREEGIVSNREADEWSNFALDPKSPFVDIVVTEDSGAEQTMNITTHYR